ncbi:MAG: 2-dehydro-3-deoxygalactonokinase [Halopseudomonas sp.]
MYIVTIDTGTTNTRVCLWQDHHFIDSEKRSVGVRNTSIDGDNHQIMEGISEAFLALLSRNRLTERDIYRVLASGMITSQLGLVEIPHAVAPVNIKTLANQMHQQVFEQICEQPIWFITGVKNFAQATTDNWEAMDIMRGEEVEVFAVLQQMNNPGPMLVVLPGSHTKFVAISDAGEIAGSCTTLAGELNAVITHNTILASSLDNRFAEQVDNEYLLLGAQSTNRVGLTRSLFSVRVLEQSGKLNHEQLASFLLGVIVETDIKAFMHSSALNYQQSQPVLICGDSLMAEAFSVLLTECHPQVKTLRIQGEEFSNMAGAGCIQVAKAAGLLS